MQESELSFKNTQSDSDGGIEEVNCNKCIITRLTFIFQFTTFDDKQSNSILPVETVPVETEPYGVASFCELTISLPIYFSTLTLK